MNYIGCLSSCGKGVLNSNRRLKIVRLATHIRLGRWTCLILLLLYLTVTLQLTVRGSSLLSHEKQLVPKLVSTSSLPDAQNLDGEPNLELSSQAELEVRSIQRPISMLKSSLSKIRKKNSLRQGIADEPLTNEYLAGRDSFISENPFRNLLPKQGIENPAQNIEEKYSDPSLQPSSDNLVDMNMMERIEGASDSRLYSKLLTKLKSLGSAVTQQQLQRAAGKCGGLQSPALRYVQTYDFVHMADHLCTAGDLLALVAVHSNAKNLGRRATIRRTWGSLRYVGRYRIEVAFFLGRPASGDSDESGATGAQLEALLDAESDRFGDIVQLNYTENYRNMSIKHLAVYEWVLRHCQSAKYLVKVDDDTFTDVAHLATFLSQGAPSGFYCSATRGARPQRFPRKAKWSVSYREFPGSFYPTYCEGFGYILNAKHVASIYLCSLFKQFFWIDDVYITGVLAASTDVPISGFWRGHGYAPLVSSRASEAIVDYIFLTAERSDFIDVVHHKLWRSVLQHSLDVAL
ncbi:hypothetical protein BOX15_Mlig021944g1 [Macrostomum lignano]|uniref:Hexosyltransferase n=1 Tax=Macrostomum lignano TaxID=282301 RepID=A0A267EL82_9PLAT|nr:hypothetical protein BOX15_Mlig021944g1 [Macrostomum lignano]